MIQEKKERQRQDAAEAEAKAAEEARAAASDQPQAGVPPAIGAAASVSAQVRTSFLFLQHCVSGCFMSVPIRPLLPSLSSSRQCSSNENK